MNEKRTPAKSFIGRPVTGHMAYSSNIPTAAFEPCPWIVTMHGTENEARAAVAKAEGK